MIFLRIIDDYEVFVPGESPGKVLCEFDYEAFGTLAVVENACKNTFQHPKIDEVVITCDIFLNEPYLFDHLDFYSSMEESEEQN
mgnify:CR=1 FL=1